MCKILVIPGIKDKTRKNALQFIKNMAVLMSSESDKDGVGYAALTTKGELFGERWYNYKEAFNTRITSTQFGKDLAEEFGGFLIPVAEDKYNSFGLGKDGLGSIAAITLHSRFATTGKEFKNTHPFVSADGKTSLIHNGVIANHEKLKKITSTCDSEVILHAYDGIGVFDDITLMEELAHQLYGYYACGVFSENSEAKMILDVFKEDTSVLHAAHIKELDTVVFSTKLDYVETACKDLEFSITQVYKIKDNMIVRMDPFTGKVLDYTSFKSNPRFYSEYSNVNRNHYGHGAGGDNTDIDKYLEEKEKEKFGPKSNVIEMGKGEFKDGDSSKEAPPKDLEKASEDPRLAKEFVHGLSDEQLVKSCNLLLTRLSSREEGGMVEGNELIKRLRGVKKESKKDYIIDQLCSGDFGWEEYLDNERGEWYFLKRSSE